MKKSLILLCIIMVIFIGGYLLLSFYSVKFVQPYLQKMVGPGFTLREIKLKTTHLSVRGIQYDDPHLKQRFLQIEEVRIYPSLFSLLKKKLLVKEFFFYRPSIFIYRSRGGEWIGPWVELEKGEKEKKELRKGDNKEESFQIQIDRIRIQKGSMDFKDSKGGDSPAHFQLKELDAEIKSILYPLPRSHSTFELKGKIQEGILNLSGWFDMKTFDLESNLEIHGLGVKAFEPYYRKKVSAEIESGSIDLESKITIKGEKINAPGKLDLVNLKVKGGGTVFWIPAKTLSILLKQKGHRIHIPFVINGDLKDPRFNLQETFITQIAFHLAEALGVPIKTVGKEIIKDPFRKERGIIEGLKTFKEIF